MRSLPTDSTERGPLTVANYDDQIRVAHEFSLATEQEKVWIKRTANQMEQFFAAFGAWVCEVCLRWNFEGTRACMATKCPGKNHHVTQQRQHERNIKKIKWNLERDFPVVAHFARMVGLTCEDQVTRSYGEVGKTLAASLNPDTLPGAEPFPENVFQPIVMQKRDLEGRNKIKGNPSMDARWNKCAKSARIKWRKRNNDDTLTCVDRFNRDLGDSELNDRRPWKDAMAEHWKLKEFTLEDAMDFDKICDEAELAKDAGEDDPYKVSKKQLNQVFGDHYVILPSDEFKGTGVQQNKCCDSSGNARFSTDRQFNRPERS